MVGERARPRGSWQFPQGGIDPGETPEIAVYREMREEIGADGFDILGRAAMPIRYFFPKTMTAEIAKRYRGQDQIWFHVRFRPGVEPDLAKATDKEFTALEWVTVAEALERVVDFKKDAYARGLSELGLIQEG